PPYKGGQNVTPSGNIFLNNTFVGTITVVSGSFQTTTVGAKFGQPFKVLVRNSEGGPAPPGLPVIFTAPGSGAAGTFGGSGTNTETVFPGPDGVATASFTANTTAGSFTVTVTATEASGSADFSLTNLALAPANVVARAGTPQNTPVTMTFA